ncbi:hypothetical protein HAX54_026150 [Datura stramonium]|uniref:Uncharacterized protein n=1 Tax=Datura stramonium TaxID=4076 RepID=A0ABS8V125_DATST|nr:hypothetical protein [Datura stramonium]
MSKLTERCMYNGPSLAPSSNQGATGFGVTELVSNRHLSLSPFCELIQTLDTLDGGSNVLSTTSSFVYYFQLNTLVVTCFLRLTWTLIARLLQEIMPPEFQPTGGGSRRRSDQADTMRHLRDENTGFEAEVQEVGTNAPSASYQTRSTARHAANPRFDKGSDSLEDGSS